MVTLKIACRKHKCCIRFEMPRTIISIGWLDYYFLRKIMICTEHLQFDWNIENIFNSNTKFANRPLRFLFSLLGNAINWNILKAARNSLAQNVFTCLFKIQKKKCKNNCHLKCKIVVPFEIQNIAIDIVQIWFNPDWVLIALPKQGEEAEKKTRRIRVAKNNPKVNSAQTKNQ